MVNKASIGDAPDLAVQFEIIKQLTDSIRQQTTALTEVQKQVSNMSERLARIEANRLHDDVERLRHDLADQTGRVDALMRDKDRRDGALGAMAWIHKSAPWAAMVAAGAAILAWVKS